MLENKIYLQTSQLRLSFLTCFPPMYLIKSRTRTVQHMYYWFDNVRMEIARSGDGKNYMKRQINVI